MLAQQHKSPQDKVRYLQRLALKQYASEYCNAQGLHNLIQEYGFSKAEVKRILKEVLEEHEVYAKSEASQQYDINTMGDITLEEWIENFLAGKYIRVE